MEKNKKLLLIASILMIVYLIPNIIINILFGIGNNEIVKWVNISLYTLSIIGIVLFMIYSFTKKNINRGLEFFISIVFLCMNIVSGILGFVYFKKIRKEIYLI